MSIYLGCIYFLIGMLVFLAGLWTFLLVKNRNKSEKHVIQNLKQKKSTLYLKYDLKTREIIINNKYTYLNLDVSKYIASISKEDEFLENIKKIVKDSGNYSRECQIEEKMFYFTFSHREKIDNYAIIKCDYDIEKIAEQVKLKNIDDIKKIHDKFENKNAYLYYLNVKDFNSVNQRYGQRCGDYVL